MRLIDRIMFCCSLLVALSLVSCGSGETSKVNDQANTGSVATVAVVHPEQRSFQAVLTVSGTVMADKQVKLSARENGYVNRILKDVGDRVQKGDVLAVLSNPELHRQREELDALVNSKRTVHERLQSTYKNTPSLVPLQQVESAEAEFNIARAKLSAVQDRIAFLQVRAPFAGVVTARSVDEGATVQSGIMNSDAMTLFEVQATDPVRIKMQVAGPDAALVEVGGKVTLKFPDKPGEEFPATVSRTSNSLDANTGTMHVEIDLPNKEGNFRPGMYANASFQQSAREGVLSLPMQAQQYERGSFYLWLVKNGEVVKVELTKGLENKRSFEVLQPQLDAETMVIVEGRNQVKPGQKVEAIVQE